MVRQLIVIALVGTVLTATPTPALADLIVYHDLGSFQAATSGLTDVNFNGIAASHSFVGYATPPGFTRSGVNFNIANALASDYINVTAANFYMQAVYPSDFLVPAVSSRTTTIESITLPDGVTAVGIDLGTFDGGTLTFTFSTGDQYVYTNPPKVGHTAFLGFTSSSPITSLTISYAKGANETLVIDDFKFGAAVVPEPSMLALACAGGVSFVVCRVVRARKRAVP
jgi:hypothetical protein